ncbi:TetR family transcriptional regulator C-terminal domain-containing protein [Streptomyces sp. NPDC056817]|uniref:TetR family transcriptional regulator C-terminal domain-containing protein n=1 Tax=Streptomyces sp. NPDC056817 TaxID=3345950 RepID=UPI0036BF3A5C
MVRLLERGGQGTDETFARGQAQRYEAWHLIERGVAEGEFTCDDLDGVTVRFAALADGLALQRLRQTPPLTTEDARRHLNRLIETELARKPQLLGRRAYRWTCWCADPLPVRRAAETGRTSVSTLPRLGRRRGHGADCVVQPCAVPVT